MDDMQPNSFTINGRAYTATDTIHMKLAETVNVAPGQRYDVIWQARQPGRWLMHCHIPQHTTNNNAEEQGDGGLMMLIDMT